MTDDARCPICVYQASPSGWRLRLIHPRCPQHGGHPHWKVTT
jgi:hypothetical protein